MSKYFKFSQHKYAIYMWLAWSVLRLLTPLLLWWNVFWGFAINVIIDCLDGDLLARMGVKRKEYQAWDKWMDLWFSLLLGIYTFYNFEVNLFWLILLIVFLWRLIGTVLFTLTKKEWLLLVFPNLQWKLFFILIVFPDWINSNWILPSPWTLVSVTVLVTIIIEWILHIAKWDTTAILFRGKRKW